LKCVSLNLHISRGMALCDPSIQNDIANTTNFSEWVSKVSTDITNISFLPDPTIDNINTLTTLAQDIKDHQDCINATTNNSANALANDITNAQNLEGINAAIEKRSHDVAISYDRAQTARNPERNRGYYDGWFPISRPLKHYTIPILIALSLFLFSLSLFYLLSLFGFNMAFMIALPPVITGPLESYGNKSLYTSKPFLIMTGIAVVLLGLTIYGFTQK